MKRFAGLAVFALCTALLAGCGGDKKDDKKDSAKPGVTTVSLELPKMV